MATLNASKWGHIVSANYLTHAAARGASTGFAATANPTNTQTSIAYRRFTARGRGNNFYQIRRSFYYFNTSGLQITSATLNIRGGTGSSSVIVMKSTAFSGDGSTNLTTANYSSISFTETYSNAYTSWTNSNNSISLNSTAVNIITSNNAFICAVIQYNNDYLNVDSLSNTEQVNQTNFSTTAYLDYQPASSSPIASVNGITRASIRSFNTIALANIDSINGIDN